MAGAFMDMVASDLEIFLADFGKEHRIEGKTIVAVFDEHALRERQGGAELGVAESSLMLFAKVADLPKQRAPGSNLNVDGVEYIVDDWTPEDGMASIALSAATV